MHVVCGGILYVVCSGPPALPGSSRNTSLLPSALRMSLLGYGTRAHATQLWFWLRKVSNIGVRKAVLSFVGISQNRTVRFGASAYSPVNGGTEFSFPVSADISRAPSVGQVLCGYKDESGAQEVG